MFKFKRKKTNRLCGEDIDGNRYVLNDNAIYKVPKGEKTGKFLCYADYWRVHRNKTVFKKDNTAVLGL